jgi:dihydroneopterin aldolase
MSSDHIRLLGMCFFGFHGALPAERDLGQRFVVDVDLQMDLQAAGIGDDLALTVSYSDVYDEVRQVVEGPPCHLIEAVAERIASRVLGAHLAVERICVRVRKPEVPIKGILTAAEVEIMRNRA